MLKRNKTKKVKKAKKLLPVTVARSRWARGMASALRLKSGKMCCLGFVARELGIPAKDILGREMPSDCSDADKEKFRAATSLLDGDENSAACERLAKTNDSGQTSHQNREAQIISLGKAAGIAFRFTN